MNIRVRPEIEEIEQEIIRIRRDIHMHPEIGFEVHRTAELAAKYLEKLGIEVVRGVGRTGVVGNLRGKSSGPTIALRADMDALPIQETGDVAYKSKVEGAMHACGHDGHTAMLLAAAKVLAEKRDNLAGNVRFIFQPSEEKGGGAEKMIEDGCLDGVDEIFGIHLWNYAPFGSVLSSPGPLLAATDSVRIQVRGVGGHGGMPHGTVDAIVVAAHLITALQSVVSRNIDPLESAVISIGTIQGGHSHNVIADSVKLEGTMRTFSEKVRKTAKERITQIVRGLEISFNTTIETDLAEGYPATINDRKSFAKLIKAASSIVGDNAKEVKPNMGGEDFSYYLQKIPGCFFFVGSSPEGKKPGEVPHHCSHFDIEEKALLVGASVLLQLIEH